MKNLRGERLSSEFQREISQIISTSLKNKCPDMLGLVSVTKADIAPDLKNANIYVSVYLKDKTVEEKSFQIIKDNAGFIRMELAHRLTIRTVPVLHFFLDDSMEYGDKIDTLLKKIHKD